MPSSGFSRANGALVVMVSSAIAGICAPACGSSNGSPGTIDVMTPDGGGGTTGTGGEAAAGGTTGAGGDTEYVVTVDATRNAVTLDGCGVTPATVAGVVGTSTLTLTASTLTKGGVSGPTPPPPSIDSYVIVHAPFPAGDADEKHRFFMLNGIGAMASVSFATAPSFDLMFIDSDTADNAGTATVGVTPNGTTATVNGATNLIAWDTGCHSTPATQTVSGGVWRLTLVDSTFSSGAGEHDDFVLVRTPSETPDDDHRYVILNGVGATQDFSPFNSQTVRMWYIGASAGTGQAHVRIARP
ncbi:MAG TPA: hypothetical protein VHJ20_00790 [Polyangia bacterium]|nr:hypothetical protein [Polyangia bacterium]